MSQSSISEKQLAANRANAARSTGPHTSEGKARSAQISRKHGFTASDFSVVRLEDVRLKADLVSVYRPVNAQELFAVERIAIAQQALLRVARLEAGLCALAMNQAVDRDRELLSPLSDTMIGTDIGITRGQIRNHGFADGFRRMASSKDQSNVWRLFLRYQAQTERRGALWARRAIEEFDRLKALRAELPNEPIVEAEPEPPHMIKIRSDEPDVPVEEPAPPEPTEPAPPSAAPATRTEPATTPEPAATPAEPATSLAPPLHVNGHAARLSASTPAKPAGANNGRLPTS
jgi:hypothetical protein